MMEVYVLMFKGSGDSDFRARDVYTSRRRAEEVANRLCARFRGECRIDVVYC